jgi:hypothetical protein
MSAAHSAASQHTPAPLKRTDTSTWIDGLPIEQYANPKSTTPRFHPQKPTSDQPTGSANAPAQPTSLNTPGARLVGTMKVAANRLTNNGTNARDHAASANQQNLPPPAQSQAGSTPSGTPQNPRCATNSPHATAPHISCQPDISKKLGKPGNVAANNSPTPRHPRATQHAGQSSRPPHVGPNEGQMPTNAAASITGHGDRHTVSHSQVTANARSIQNAPHRPGMFHCVFM